jgi:glutamate formiminotransferase
MILSATNVSEGRRPEVVDAIAGAIREVAGVRLLDYSFDPSHNRSVVMFAGDAGPIERALMALYGRALPRWI